MTAIIADLVQLRPFKPFNANSHAMPPTTIANNPWPKR